MAKSNTNAGGGVLDARYALVAHTHPDVVYPAFTTWTPTISAVGGSELDLTGAIIETAWYRDFEDKIEYGFKILFPNGTTGATDQVSFSLSTPASFNHTGSFVAGTCNVSTGIGATDAIQSPGYCEVVGANSLRIQSGPLTVTALASANSIFATGRLIVNYF